MARELVPIIIVFIVVGIPVICGTLLKLARLLVGEDGVKGVKNSKKNKTDWGEETRLIQEMHKSLSKLESRIGSLETIVLQNERKR